MVKGSKKQSSQPSQSSTAGDPAAEPYYIMENVLEYKQKSGRDFYLVKWKNFDASEATWEPRTNLLNPGDDLLTRMTELKGKVRNSLGPKSPASAKTGKAATTASPRGGDNASKTTKAKDTAQETVKETAKKGAGASSSAAKGDGGSERGKRSRERVESEMETADTTTKRRSVTTTAPQVVAPPSPDSSRVTKKPRHSLPQVESTSQASRGGGKGTKSSSPASDVNAGANQTTTEKSTAEETRRKSAPAPSKDRESRTGVTKISSHKSGVLVTVSYYDSQDGSDGAVLATKQISMEEARQDHTQALLDFLLARLRFQPGGGKGDAGKGGVNNLTSGGAQK